MKKLILIALILILFSGNALAWTIDGNKVYENNSHVYLSAEPHTLSSSGWVYFNLTSWDYTGNADFVWGFTDDTTPTKAELYNHRWVNYTTDHELYLDNVINIQTTIDSCECGNSYNNYKRNITTFIEGNISSEDVYISKIYCFDSYVYHGVGEYTIYWTTEHSQFKTWIDWTNKFGNKINHDYADMDKWYPLINSPIVAGKSYTMRVWIDIPITLNGGLNKYCWAAKPSDETIGEAILAGHFYLLDPWYNNLWTERKEIILTGNTSGAQTDYQILLNVSYESGMQPDFDDLRFCNDTHKIDSWLESKVNSSYALVWVEFPTTPANGGNQTYYMYYKNDEAVSNWDIGATFLFGDDFPGVALDGEKWTTIVGSASVSGGECTLLRSGGTDDDIRTTTGFGANTAYRSKLKMNLGAYFQQFGMSNRITDINWHSSEDGSFYYQTSNAQVYSYTNNEVVYTRNLNALPDANYHTYDITRLSGECKFYRDEGLLQTHTTNIPDELCYGGGKARGSDGSQIIMDWMLVRKYVTNPPSYEFGSTQYYAGSIHYNASSPYNHTIESDGTITANHTIIASDNINWTAAALTADCQFLVTEYNYDNTTLANFTVYSNILNWLQITNLTPTHSYRLQYANGTEINTTNANANGIINYTEDFIPDNYQIVSSDTSVTIALYSSSPCCIFTNYTGVITGNYIVESNYPLNYSSLAFLMGVNYTPTSDMHSYLKVPSNTIASDGIYRAHNRNTTPFMSWENNTTITEDNVWQWSGGDNDSFWITKSQINDTHTWINMTGIASNVFPSMFYLGRQAIYAAPKTGIEINQHQGIIIKLFDLEGYRDRDNDYYISMYPDTQLESTTPTENIDIWYCNNSFAPLVDDPTTCPYCVRTDTWASSRWMDHEAWQPHTNVSYAKPLTAYADTYPEIPPDEVMYLYFASDTLTSKSYVLNATNYDPGICNITYAQTNTMWTYNELSDTSTAIAYTPSFYATFVRDYEEFLHHLYIANDQGVWGHSDIYNISIGISDVPPTHCLYNYYWWGNTTDYNMNGSYIDNFWINLTYGFDPDNGAALTHVLSLYDTDYNFVVFVNDSLEGNATDVDIFVDISDYNPGEYMFKIVSTDNEGSTSVTWSKEFTLSGKNSFWLSIKIIQGFPTAIGNILTTFLSFLPLLVGILISGFILIVSVSVFSKFKRW